MATNEQQAERNEPDYFPVPVWLIDKAARGEISDEEFMRQLSALADRMKRRTPIQRSTSK